MTAQQQRTACRCAASTDDMSSRSYAVSATRLTVALLAGLLVTAGCAPEPRAREATLGNLVVGSDHFAGQRVITEGVVQSFPQPRHYWLEDDHRNRVGLEPVALIASLEGAQVRVTGMFSVEPDRGRLIRVTALEVLAGP